jgi:leucyl-tRNA synthetase
MENKYNHKAIEKKWAKRWSENPVNEPDDSKPKFYCLDMFPYPSGTGLHVGHWRGYVISDVISRYKIMQGYQVLHPMGWDAFGLPAENYAIKMKIHPEDAVKECIGIFKRQYNDIRTVNDWRYELSTTDPAYYRWTQWIFVQMWRRGLAYEKEMPLNWCPSCKVVLANEEVVAGGCERCGTEAQKRNLRQWMLRITDYAERLLTDLDGLDWPDKVKKMQSDWIGKSYGAEIQFAIHDSRDVIGVFTTRPDTLYGATFMVLAPEHELVAKITADGQMGEVEAYVKAAGAKSNVDRMAAKEKTGVFTGVYAVNPLNGARIPVWVSDYVLIDYGTGAIMCVPAHDERDYEFAVKFGLEIVQVIKKGDEALPYIGDGVLVNSGQFDGIEAKKAVEVITDYLEKQGIGKKTVNYKLRDWVFSRQRYWGEPIPLIHCGVCGVVPVPEDDLPVMLPRVEYYEPTDTGESPLAKISDWVNVVCPVCGAAAKRETNTMPQWAGSSWYFMRYPDVNNDKELVGKAVADKWLPVDYYLGGIEHAILHLLYARFYTKFLYDIGAVGFDEPFKKLFNNGMVMKKGGGKISKSKDGADFSPDPIVEKYGRDSLRMYEMFIGPPEQDAEWDERGIEGVYRFLNKLWRLAADVRDLTTNNTNGTNKEQEYVKNKMIHDITARLDNLSLNTVVSGFMEYTNKLTEMVKTGGAGKRVMDTLFVLLAPFAPHIAEELWELNGNDGTVFSQAWPVCDASKMVEDTIQIVVQINGKLRGDAVIKPDAAEADAVAAARAAVAGKLEGVNVVKAIYVKGKLVNFVVR